MFGASLGRKRWQDRIKRSRRFKPAPFSTTKTAPPPARRLTFSPKVRTSVRLAGPLSTQAQRIIKEGFAEMGHRCFERQVKRKGEPDRSLFSQCHSRSASARIREQNEHDCRPHPQKKKNPLQVTPPLFKASCKWIQLSRSIFDVMCLIMIYL